MDNIELAYSKAKRRKTWKRSVKKVEKNREKLLKKIQNMLTNHTYKTSAYHTKIIHEPKERLIYILPFYPDRIIHHAVMNVLEPVWDSLLISDTYSCRKGKGQHKASRKCMQYVKKYEYCMQFDIRKFYPSLHHETLKKIIRKKIKDKEVLMLLDEIIDSTHTERNVPIGNYLSQWFGNIYMNEVDMFVKHELRIKPYIRYCDDFLIFGDNKKEMHEIADEIEQFLDSKLKLSLSKKNLFHTTQGVDFLGYRHFKSGKILIRKSTAKRMKKRIKKLKWELKTKRITRDRVMSVLGSISGWLKHANTHNLSISLHLKELKELNAKSDT